MSFNSHPLKAFQKFKGGHPLLYFYFLLWSLFLLPNIVTMHLFPQWKWTNFFVTLFFCFGTMVLYFLLTNAPLTHRHMTPKHLILLEILLLCLILFTSLLNGWLPASLMSILWVLSHSPILSQKISPILCPIVFACQILISLNLMEYQTVGIFCTGIHPSYLALLIGILFLLSSFYFDTPSTKTLRSLSVLSIVLSEILAVLFFKTDLLFLIYWAILLLMATLYYKYALNQLDLDF